MTSSQALPLRRKTVCFSSSARSVQNTGRIAYRTVLVHLQSVCRHDILQLASSLSQAFSHSKSPQLTPPKGLSVLAGSPQNIHDEQLFCILETEQNNSAPP